VVIFESVIVSPPMAVGGKSRPRRCSRRGRGARII